MKNLKLNLIIDTLVKLSVSTALIVAALTTQQYTYYILLRWFVFISFLYFSYRSLAKKEMGLIFLFLGVAIIFNPAQKFLFQKETWHLLDYLIAGITILTIIYDWFHYVIAIANPFSKLIDKTLFKKRIAKEVLFFFAALTLIGLIWGSLLLRNTYNNTKKKDLAKEITSLTTQLYNLPSDQIKKIYDGLSNKLVVNYKVDNDPILAKLNQEEESINFAISKGEEYEFRNDNPSATRLPNYTNGYSYFRLYNVKLKNGVAVKYSSKSELGKLVKRKYPEYSDFTDFEIGQKILEKYPSNLDSLVVFNFVDLETFRRFLMQKDYRDKFYQIFRWQKYLRIYDTQNEHSILEKRTPYDLGSQEAFESNVQLGLKFDNAVIKSRNKIIKEINSNQKALQIATASIWDSGRINEFLLMTVLIIAVILYPLRLTFLLIKWAIKTVR